MNMTPVVTNGLAIWCSVTCHTAAMPCIALSLGVGVEVILRLAASRLAVPARAAPHANLGHTNNNTVSQSTTGQLHDFRPSPLNPMLSLSLLISGGQRLKTRLNDSYYVGAVS